MAREEFRIPKLSGDNYHPWSIRARAALVQKKCWEAVEPGYGGEMTDIQRSKNEEALTFMFLIVDDNFLDDIGDCRKASEAWKSLKDMHTKFGLLHVLQLMKEFFNITMKGNESIKSYLGRLMEIHRKLSSGGYAFTDREVALVMLIGLPKAYETLILNLEKDEEGLTMAVVKSRLLVEEKRISRNENADVPEERALHVKNMVKKGTYDKPVKKWPQKKHEEETDPTWRRTKCFSCGEWGHISKNCGAARQKSRGDPRQSTEARNWALSAKGVDRSAGRQWILDSGATEHMTSDSSKLKNMESFSSNIEVANSETVEVTGKGDAMIQICTDGKAKGSITLAGVLYAPNLGGSLLSVGRIEEQGYKVIFEEGEALIKTRSEDIILRAKREDRLYIVEQEKNTACLAKTMKEDLWHRRLGHPHRGTLEKLSLTHSKDKTHKGAEELCPVCLQGKMRHKKFPKNSSTRATEALQIVHSDMAGKISPTSKGGSK